MWWGDAFVHCGAVAVVVSLVLSVDYGAVWWLLCGVCRFLVFAVELLRARPWRRFGCQPLWLVRGQNGDMSIAVGAERRVYRSYANGDRAYSFREHLVTPETQCRFFWFGWTFEHVPEQFAVTLQLPGSTRHVSLQAALQLRRCTPHPPTAYLERQLDVLLCALFDAVGLVCMRLPSFATAALLFPVLALLCIAASFVSHLVRQTAVAVAIGVATLRFARQGYGSGAWSTGSRWRHGCAAAFGFVVLHVVLQTAEHPTHVLPHIAYALLAATCVLALGLELEIGPWTAWRIASPPLPQLPPPHRSRAPSSAVANAWLRMAPCVYAMIGEYATWPDIAAWAGVCAPLAGSVRRHVRSPLHPLVIRFDTSAPDARAYAERTRGRVLHLHGWQLSWSDLLPFSATLEKLMVDATLTGNDRLQSHAASLFGTLRILNIERSTDIDVLHLPPALTALAVGSLTCPHAFDDDDARVPTVLGALEVLDITHPFPARPGGGTDSSFVRRCGRHTARLRQVRLRAITNEDSAELVCTWLSGCLELRHIGLFFWPFRGLVELVARCELKRLEALVLWGPTVQIQLDLRRLTTLTDLTLPSHTSLATSAEVLLPPTVTRLDAPIGALGPRSQPTLRILRLVVPPIPVRRDVPATLRATSLALRDAATIRQMHHLHAATTTYAALEELELAVDTSDGSTRDTAMILCQMPILEKLRVLRTNEPVDTSSRDLQQCLAAFPALLEFHYPSRNRQQLAFARPPPHTDIRVRHVALHVDGMHIPWAE